jgi:hypothetical protein
MGLDGLEPKSSLGIEPQRSAHGYLETASRTRDPFQGSPSGTASACPSRRKQGPIAVTTIIAQAGLHMAEHQLQPGAQGRKESRGLGVAIEVDVDAIHLRCEGGAERKLAWDGSDQGAELDEGQGRLKVISSRARCHASQCEHSPDVVAQFLLARVN